MKRTLVVLIAIILLVASCSSPLTENLINSDSQAKATWTISGVFTHDPTMIKAGSTYYMFFTATGIGVKTSTNGTTWGTQSQFFPSALSWWSTYANCSNEIWAPDIILYNGMYYLFYAGSSFGTNTSFIGGLKKSSVSTTNTGWTDMGKIINSTSSNNYNCIDPSIALDASGAPWLSFGSFWNDIFITKLDPSTMMPTGAITNIAYRATNPATGTLAANSHACEAPAIMYNNGYYYLFTSWDQCCQGSNSTYKIVYSRATAITGPYKDKAGNNALNSTDTLGGTLLQGDTTDFKGPGGQHVWNNAGQWVMDYHAYTAGDTSNGGARLFVKDLYFDTSGWPTFTAQPTVVCNITSPASGAAYVTGTAITINATATCTSGTISKVDFYNGTTLLGTDTTSPYSYSWTPAAGSFNLTAKATNSAALTGTSPAVAITVDATGLSVNITSPAAGTGYGLPATVTINATATTISGTITKVEFYAGTTLLGSDTTSPYSYAWTPTTSATWSLTAKAYNAAGNKTSSAVSVTTTTAPMGTYTIKNVNSGKVLEIANAGTNDWAYVTQYTLGTHNCQKWVISDAGSGNSYIVNLNSSKRMEVGNNNTNNGAFVNQLTANTNLCQKWKLIPSGSNFKIQNANSLKYIQVQSASTANGAMIEQQPLASTNNQLWTLTKL